MNIDEVTEILGLCHALLAPQHIIITEETVSGKLNGQGTFRGLQPTAKGDVVFLGGDADSTTPIHETIHANFGLEELATVPLTRIIHLKYQLLKRFPNVANMVKRKIRYQEVMESKEYPSAHIQPFKGRVKHYVRVK